MSKKERKQAKSGKEESGKEKPVREKTSKESRKGKEIHRDSSKQSSPPKNALLEKVRTAFLVNSSKSKQSAVKNKNRRQRRGELDGEMLAGQEALDGIIAWILVAVLLLIPLLIRVHTGQFVAPRFIADIIDSGIRGDVFTYYKAGILYFSAALALFLLLMKVLLYKYEIRASYINIPLFILAGFILLSGVMAEFKGLALAGMYNRHDGVFTLLSCLTLFFVAANSSFKFWFRRVIPLLLAAVMLINVVIILCHFYGHDLYQLDSIKAMIVPASLQNASVSGTLWSTFNNPNYVSGFAAALSAFFLALALLRKSWQERLGWGVCAVLSFAMMMAAISTSGWIALGLALLLIIAMAWRRGEKKETLFTGMGVAAGWLLVFLILNAHNPAAGNEPLGFFQHTIQATWNEITMTVPEEKDKGKEAPGQQQEGEQLPQEAAESAQLADEFNLPARGQSAGSGRMYIWEKTIELVKERPLLGYGPDTLPYYFPQNDPYKIAGMGSYSSVVDKPHSFYLQIAYGSGLIALLALLALFLLHLFHAGKTFFTGHSNGFSNGLSEEKEGLALQGALLAFFLAFIIQWLFNDSIVGTSPVFWTLFGVAVTMGEVKGLHE